MEIVWIMLGGSYLLALVVGQRVKAAYRKWGAIENSAHITGQTTSRTILAANEISGVEINPIPGAFTDHYNPQNRSIQLSEPVFGVPSIAAMAVAAHESGHAIQHDVGYWPLAVRTSAAPLVNVAARFGIPAAFMGLLFGITSLVQLGVIAYVGALAFQLLTLPLEFDARRRALAQLQKLRLLTAEEEKGVESILRAAAMTYVSGAASSAAYVVYLAFLAGRLLTGKTPPIPPPRLP